MIKKILYSLVTRIIVVGSLVSVVFYAIACRYDASVFPGGWPGFVLTGMLSVTILLFLIAFLFVRRINKIQRIIKEMASGNLALEWKTGFPDEAGIFAAHLLDLREKWGGAFDRILPLSVDIESVSRELKVASDRTHKHSVTQTSQAEDSAAAARQLSSSVKQTSEKSNSVSNTTKEVIESVENSRTAANRSIQAMDNLSRTTRKLAQVVTELNEGMVHINGIVELIKNIADQTNLLALNAAIEAARAGGAGGRFSVVSDEVRKLAENTINATQDISQRMEGIISTSFETSEMMNLAIQENQETESEIKKLVQGLSFTLDSFQSVVRDVQSISELMGQEAITADHVSDTMLNSLEGTRSILAEAKKVNDSVSRLTGVTDELREATLGLKTHGSKLLILDLAKTDHRIFVSRIDEHLEQRIRLEETDVNDHFSCRFGKWYYSDGIKEAGDLQSFKEIEKPHAEIHQIAKKAVEARNSGNAQLAKELQEQLHEISGGIQKQLAILKEDYSKKLK